MQFFYSGCTNLHSRKQCTHYTSLTFVICGYFDDSHSDRGEVIPDYVFFFFTTPTTFSVINVIFYTCMFIPLLITVVIADFIIVFSFVLAYLSI